MSINLVSDSLRIRMLPSYAMIGSERGNGYPGKGYVSEVHFTIIRIGSSWAVTSFSAVY